MDNALNVRKVQKKKKRKENRNWLQGDAEGRLTYTIDSSSTYRSNFDFNLIKNLLLVPGDEYSLFERAASGWRSLAAGLPETGRDIDWPIDFQMRSVPTK